MTIAEAGVFVNGVLEDPRAQALQVDEINSRWISLVEKLTTLVELGIREAAVMTQSVCDSQLERLAYYKKYASMSTVRKSKQVYSYSSFS